MTMNPASVGVPGVSATLADFVANSRWEEVPEAVRHEARRSLLNFFAAALAAARDPVIDMATRTYARFSSGQQATLIGRLPRVDMLTAAALNAMAANVYDFDDTHHPTIIHPTSPVAPALFALAETRSLTGAQLLHAFILGVEATCRIGNAMSPGHYARGWHITSTCGVFGAAVGVARCLKLDGPETLNALGAAAAQAGGLVETLGTAAKSVSVGNAARNGLLSALLAAEGFDGPRQPLEGARGYLRVAADTPDIGEISADFGSRWELLNNTYKPYPCGVVLNPVIEACLELASHPRIAEGGWADIARIELTGHPLLRQRADRPDITTGRQSQVCAQHAVAVTLLRGRAGLAEFSDDAVANDDVRALGGKLTFRDDAAMSVDAVMVRIEFGHGLVLEREIEAARGSLAKPLEDGEIEDKLRALCRYGGVNIDVERLIEAVWTLDQTKDAACVIRLAAGRSDPPTALA